MGAGGQNRAVCGHRHPQGCSQAGCLQHQAAEGHQSGVCQSGISLQDRTAQCLHAFQQAPGIMQVLLTIHPPGLLDVWSTRQYFVVGNPSFAQCALQLGICAIQLCSLQHPGIMCLCLTDLNLTVICIHKPAQSGAAIVPLHVCPRTHSCSH